MIYHMIHHNHQSIDPSFPCASTGPTGRLPELRLRRWPPQLPGKAGGRSEPWPLAKRGKEEENGGLPNGLPIWIWINTNYHQNWLVEHANKDYFKCIFCMFIRGIRFWFIAILILWWAFDEPMIHHDSSKFSIPFWSSNMAGWKMDHRNQWFPQLESSIYRGFPIAMFDYQRFHWASLEKSKGGFWASKWG